MPDRGPVTRRFLCRCECGTVRIFTFRSLRCGTRSCGCLKREMDSAKGSATKRHGLSHTANYRRWRGMRARCDTPSVASYPYYGGRGITVCDRWRGMDGFENFLADMGEPPEGLMIDRIDNDGNYEPGNCRWATRAEQNANRRPFKKREGH